MIQPLTDEKPYTLTPGSDGVIETQTLEVSIGPQHPSTHGVFRMDCVLDGESVVALRPVMATCIVITNNWRSVWPGWDRCRTPTGSIISIR